MCNKALPMASFSLTTKVQWRHQKLSHHQYLLPHHPYLDCVRQWFSSIWQFLVSLNERATLDSKVSSIFFCVYRTSPLTHAFLSKDKAPWAIDNPAGENIFFTNCCLFYSFAST